MPRDEPAAALLQKKTAPHRKPQWAGDRIDPCWWKQYGDAALNCDIRTAFENSPDLQMIAARLDQADREVQLAKTAAWPQLNAGYGFRFGRTKEFDQEKYNLAPWTGRANLSWELDVFHKLRRARESAEFNRRAVFWELSAARLLLATRIAESRFRIYRLKKETSLISESLYANRDILKILQQRVESGLTAETEVHRMTAETEKLSRGVQELQRLRQLAEVELQTLKGGRTRDCNVSGSLPGLPSIPARCFNELVCCHPSLLEAESQLRAAYRIEESARLNLLPSFTVQGNLTGASPHFFLDQFKRWHREIGPVLDIPIFDPSRRVNLGARRAETNEACAKYRSTLVQIVGDVESAYINLASRRKQMSSAAREVTALKRARLFVTANFGAGIVSQVEVLESERSYLESSRALIALEEAALQDHLALIRALGGGCCEDHELPLITAEPLHQ